MLKTLESKQPSPSSISNLGAVLEAELSSTVPAASRSFKDTKNMLHQTPLVTYSFSLLMEVPHHQSEGTAHLVTFGVLCFLLVKILLRDLARIRKHLSAWKIPVQPICPRMRMIFKF